MSGPVFTRIYLSLTSFNTGRRNNFPIVQPLESSMKLSKTLRLATVSILSALSLAATAAPMDGGDHGMQHMHGGDHSRMAGMTPMALHQLDLSETQQDKVFELMHGQAKQRYELMRAIRNNRAALRELARAPGFDTAKAQTLADEQGRLMAQQAFQRAQTEAQLRALLTPEQRKKLDERREDGPRGERMGPARPPRQ